VNNLLEEKLVLERLKFIDCLTDYLLVNVLLVNVLLVDVTRVEVHVTPILFISLLMTCV
jgi:hypothetical protein